MPVPMTMAEKILARASGRARVGAGERLERAEGQRMQEDVDLRPLGCQGVGDLLALLRVGGVHVEVQGAPPGRGDLRLDLLDLRESRLAVEVHAADVEPRLRERDGALGPEPARGAEDDRPALTVRHDPVPLWSAGNLAFAAVGDKL